MREIWKMPMQEQIEAARAKLMESLRDFDACLMTGPTSIMHFCGFPSVALRLGMGKDNTLRGMILYGADEKRLLSAALCIERFTQPVAWPKNIE